MSKKIHKKRVLMIVNKNYFSLGSLVCLLFFLSFSAYSFFRPQEGPSYPFGPFYGSSSSARYEFIIPPDHDEYDMDYFYPGNSFEYDTYSNYQRYDSVDNIDDEGLFVY